MERIALTRATGHIGGRLAPKLLAAGYGLRCLVRSSRKLEGRDWVTDAQVEVRQAHLSDLASLTNELSGCDAAFYLFHSMMSADPEYAKQDMTLAFTFAAAAREATIVTLAVSSAIQITIHIKHSFCRLIDSLVRLLTLGRTIQFRESRCLQVQRIQLSLPDQSGGTWMMAHPEVILALHGEFESFPGWAPRLDVPIGFCSHAFVVKGFESVRAEGDLSRKSSKSSSVGSHTTCTT